MTFFAQNAVKFLKRLVVLPPDPRYIFELCSSASSVFPNRRSVWIFCRSAKKFAFYRSNGKLLCFLLSFLAKLVYWVKLQQWNWRIYVYLYLPNVWIL